MADDETRLREIARLLDFPHHFASVTAREHVRWLLAQVAAVRAENAAEVDRLTRELAEQNGTTHALNLAEKLRKAEAQMKTARGLSDYCAVCYHPLDQCSHCDLRTVPR
jgi:hypothetical protein